MSAKSISVTVNRAHEVLGKAHKETMKIHHVKVKKATNGFVITPHYSAEGSDYAHHEGPSKIAKNTKEAAKHMSDCFGS